VRWNVARQQASKKSAEYARIDGRVVRIVGVIWRRGLATHWLLPWHKLLLKLLLLLLRGGVKG